MRKAIETTPNRKNWTQFCEEPELSRAEWREWREMVKAIQADNVLLDEVIEATREVKAEADAAYQELGSTDDWSDFVANVDAGRRLQQAELAWWREYQTKGDEPND